MKTLTVFLTVLLVSAILAMPGARQAAAATTWQVDDLPQLDCPGAPYTSIQAAISAPTTMPGDTIDVCPGTYVENVTLNKSLTLLGEQAGTDARGRMTSNESTITAPAGILLNLVTGSAGSTIDGFTFAGATRGIESTSGPQDGVQILNNRILLFTNAGVFLNRDGINITVNQNEIDGSAKLGGGGLFHLDTDNFDGLWFTNNNVISGVQGTGFFVDGVRNVDRGTPGSRIPRFEGNRVDGNGTGANLGRGAWGDGPISDNTFSNNVGDGLQGGPKNSAISNNSFASNGGSGLSLTSFSNVNPNFSGPGQTAGAQGNTISQNCFTRNGSAQPLTQAGIRFSATQFAGTISTNRTFQNNITGNVMGARYPLPGAELIVAEFNWWGSSSGPGLPDGTGSGDGVDGHTRIDFDPWLTAPVGGTPCSAGAPFTLTLEDAAAMNPVDTEHCVTATVRDAAGQPVPGVIVRFEVTGSVSTSGSATTDANGQAEFCYDGPPLPGADDIHAYADTNGDNDQDAPPPAGNEPFDDAVKVWTLPASTEFCEVKITNGGWIIAANEDRASFGGNAKSDGEDNLSGQEEYQDHGPAQPMNVHSTEITAITCTEDRLHATIFGKATIDGSEFEYIFRIDVTDMGSPSTNDEYGIQLSNGYNSGIQPLQGGNVTIHRP